MPRPRLRPKLQSTPPDKPLTETALERLKAVAEGRVPGAPAPETAPDDRG